jgi:hypothetical protein
MSLTTEQWNELHRRYPGSMSFVIRCELSNEYIYLTRLKEDGFLGEWHENRLNELDTYQRETNQDLTIWNQ